MSEQSEETSVRVLMRDPDAEARKEAARAMGRVSGGIKAEKARANGMVMKGKTLTEEQKAAQKAGRAAYDARRKQEAAERAEKRQADAETERERKRAERATQLATVEQKVKPVEQIIEWRAEVNATP